MKFIKIATISFLAGNAVVAATPTYSAECEKANDDLEACVMKAIEADTTGTKLQEWEEVIIEAVDCYGAAGDEVAIEACGKPIEALLVRDCPDGLKALMTACDESSSVVSEDFAFNLAEELEFESFAEELAEEIAGEISEELVDGAFWEEVEDEFITTTKKSKKACLKEGEKIKVCIEDTLAKDTKKTMKWGSALEKAADKATRCANKVDDDDAKLACASSLFDLTDKYCPMIDFKKACDITSFEFEVFAATPTYSAECEKANGDLEACVMKAIEADTTGTKLQEWEEVIIEAVDCYGAAGDVAAIEACGKPIEALLVRDCPDGLKALMTACDESSSVVSEDFAFNLAEELVSTAYAYGLRGSAIEEE